ncbi:MAG: DUF2029 domain-containing protein [Candidatus Methanomethylophilaceae archaeon]|nr:DUF2029 domain-containing protein [Candidatus Methanomethylophilaceae archaeon]
MASGGKVLEWVRKNPDTSFIILYTILYALIIVLSDIINGVVGNNYAWYDVYFYWEHARDIMAGAIPYVDFQTAYPPFSFVVDLIPYFFTPDEIMFHYGFSIFTYLVSLLAIFGLFKFCDKVGLEHKYVYLTFLLLILGLNNFFIARNDTITTVFVVLCLLFYFDRRYVPAFIFLALGIMTKIYPIFLLPVLLIPFLAKKDLKSTVGFGALTALVCLIIELPFLINDPSTAFSYLFQHSGRGMEIESIVAIPFMIIGLIDSSLVYVGMDESWDLFGPLTEVVEPFLMPFTFAAILLFLVYFLYKMWKTGPGEERVLPVTFLACAMTLLLFMALNKVYCAQYIMWVIMLYPLLIWSFKELGLDHRQILKYMAVLAATTLLNVLCMTDATDSISVIYILSDILRAAATIVLCVYIFKAFKGAFVPAAAD